MTVFDGELLEWESNIRVTMNGDNELLETVQQEWSSRAVLEKKCMLQEHLALSTKEPWLPYKGEEDMILGRDFACTKSALV